MSLVPYLIHHQMLVFMVLLLYMRLFISGGLTLATEEDDKISCNDNEMKALLDFKGYLVDINNSLHDWGHKNKDCCQWVGVTCDNQIGHVTELNLSTASNVLSGNISPLLPSLSQLVLLDLSGIDFKLNHIPNSLSSLTNLKYLNLSVANLSGSIPHQLSNLFNLIRLDLSGNLLSGPIPVSFGDNLASLNKLDLSKNLLDGVIPKSFSNLSSLTHLDLSNNLLNGSVPDFVGCPSLQKLDLSWNELTGNLPISVGNLSNLDHLDVSSNSLDGVISDVHFLNLTQLTYLHLSFNNFTINLSSHAGFRFNLETIRMQSCKLGPGFPMWMKTQRKFVYLDISNAGISDHIPGWFWELPYALKFLNLSSNEIKGTLPNMTSVSFDGYPGMDLSYNQLEGRIPILPSKLAALNLSGNKFSGTLSFLCHIEITLTLLDLSNNLLSGSLPDCWVKFYNNLVVLNLSNNSLSGEIPSSLGSLSQLQALYLRKNAFTGEVPMTLSNCTKLNFVDLGENKLSGNIPSWIGERLSKLYVLVLRSNRLVGHIPSQICLLKNLKFLDMSNNGLSGNIPRCFGNLTAMATTKFQDDIMSHSYYSYKSNGLGTAVNRQTAIITVNACGDKCGGTYESSYHGRVSTLYDRPVYSLPIPDEDALFIDNTLVAWKGTQREIGKGLYLLKIIDISSNKLCGKLPYEITNLRGLLSLNFSNNKLQGEVPKDMGRLRFLESIDLSRNEFSGHIPSSLSQLTYLSYLDLSYNDLSGRIPTGTQLQGFNYTSYTGNPQLCGPPLTPRCGLPPPPNIEGSEDNEDGEDEFWKSYYTGIVAGFVVGFWGICGALILNYRCICLFFASLNSMKDWIHVTTVVHFRNLRTKFKRF